CNINFLYNEHVDSIEKANSLSQFISLQKNLQHIALSENEIYSIFYIFEDNYIDDYYNIVFYSLSTQSKSLQKLELINLPFNKINEKALDSLCCLTNIKELKLYECGWIKDNLYSWAKNLKKVEAFELVARYYS